MACSEKEKLKVENLDTGKRGSGFLPAGDYDGGAFQKVVAETPRIGDGTFPFSLQQNKCVFHSFVCVTKLFTGI